MTAFSACVLKCVFRGIMILKTGSSLLCLALFTGIALLAQTPSIDNGGVVNAASYAYAGLPSAAIAQGSIFAIFGKNLGPVTFVQSGAYPILTQLGGTSVKVTSGAVTGQALLFLASAGQITAMLPSNIPAGSASLSVTTSAGTSAEQSFQVAANSFGIFAANSGGSGPGIITDANYQSFNATTAANPGQAAVIWGTGLGPVTGNEAAGPLNGDTTVPVEVYVGTTKAAVTYRGRSGCCAGLDQIVFTVPADVTGCRVPVTLKINSVVSNTTTMAISSVGTRTCSDVGGPTPADRQKFQTNGAAIGGVTLSRISTTQTVPFLGSMTTTTDLGAATFQKFTPTQLDTAGNPFNTVQPGSCTVSYFKWNSSPGDVTLPQFLDAGAQISVNGAAGLRQLTKVSAGGFTSYTGPLSVPGSSTGYLEPGAFTITGPGGTDVGAFTGSLTVPASLNWTNRAAISDVIRANGQTVTWTGADPAGTILISGSSASGTTVDAVGAIYACYANASAGTFTIPAQVLLALPVSAVVQNLPTGAMLVGTYGAAKPFTAAGLDVGSMLYLNLSATVVNYK